MEFQQEQNHQCSFCDFTSPYKSQLEVHVRTHTREKPFFCDQCQRGFTSQPYIRSHIIRVHQGPKQAPEKTHKCSLCPYATPFKSGLKKHKRTHMKNKSVNNKEKYQKERKYLCQFPKCGYRAEISSLLKRHSLRHKDRRPFACDLQGCSYRAKTKTALREHLGVHTSRPKPFVCPTCDYHTISESSLRNHQLVHQEERTVNCDFSGCQYSCKSKAALAQHVRNRHKEKTFKCDFGDCLFVGALRCKLKDHIKKVHYKYEHKCPLCDYRAAYPSGIQTHVEMSHKPLQRIPCPTTGCTFHAKTRASLKRHMEYHKANLGCPVDGCSYVGCSSGIKRHMRLHDPTGRPFPCPLCPKHFPTNPDLSIHLRSHTREKLLKCHACPFESAHKSTITNHVRAAHSSAPSAIEDTSTSDHFGINFGCGSGLAMHRVKLKTAVVVLTRLRINFGT